MPDRPISRFVVLRLRFRHVARGTSVAVSRANASAVYYRASSVYITPQSLERIGVVDMDSL